MAYYVVSTDPNRYRLANNGKLYAGTVNHGRKSNNVKEFNYLGAAKKAAEKATDENPWVNLVVIKVEPNEFLRPDGGVTRISDETGEHIDSGNGRMVAQVVKSNLQTALFG